MAKKIDVKDALKDLEVEILEFRKNPHAVLDYLKNASMQQVNAFYAQSGKTYPILEVVQRHAASGDKRRRSLEEARDHYNEQRQIKAVERHEQWCVKARPEWAKHPKWGALKVAEKIAEKGESPDTIRKIIIAEKPTLK